jgi:hypothetical protein
MTPTQASPRVGIYTHKSTEHNLYLESNSLVACLLNFFRRQHVMSRTRSSSEQQSSWRPGLRAPGSLNLR